jgi:cytochrome P450
VYGHIPGLSLLQFVSSPNQLAERSAEYGRGINKLVKIDTPVISFVLATHPDSAKFFLANDELFPKTEFKSSKNSWKVFSNNVVFSNGEQWRRYRNVLSPPFHFDAVKKWIPDFQRLTAELMHHWKAQATNPIDMVHWLPLFTLDVLGLTVFSRSFNAMSGEQDADVEAVSLILSDLQQPLTMFLGFLERTFGVTLLPKINQAVDHIEKSMLDIINSRKSRKTVDAHFDVVDVMLSAHDPSWNEKELVSNALTVFAAGYDTTSSALTWLMYHVTAHQEVQLKMRREVDQVLNGGPVTQDNLKELVYLSYVIKENLRIQPPARFVPTRIAVQDVEFENTRIPKGSQVGVNIWALHRSSEHWTNPEEFNPDRFAKPIAPFTFLPFSLKSRACLGNQFSLVEQTVFTATLLQHVTLDSLSAFKPPNTNAINKPMELKVNLSAL